MARTKKDTTPTVSDPPVETEAEASDRLVEYVKAQGEALGPTSMAARMADKPVADWPSGYREAVSLRAGRDAVEPEVDAEG